MKNCIPNYATVYNNGSTNTEKIPTNRGHYQGFNSRELCVLVSTKPNVVMLAQLLSSQNVARDQMLLKYQR